MGFKIINLEQNTKEWEQWRKDGIGASDAPIIMGASPWKSPYDLWSSKVSHDKESSGSNYAQKRGKEMEPLIRLEVEKKLGMKFSPLVAESDEFPILRASLDGWNPEFGIPLEIKYACKDMHAVAADSKKVPVVYYPQIQHALIVTEAPKLIYASYSTDHDLALVDVYPDKKFQEEYFQKVADFWNRVTTHNPPEKTPPLKGITVVESENLRTTAEAFIQASMRLEEIEAQYKQLKEDLLSGLPKHDKVYCGGVTVTRYSTKGSIDYGHTDIQKLLKGVELERYRKADKQNTKITISQGLDK